jgi:hypothetical protein
VANDFEAMQFIEQVIVGRNCSALEALQQAENAPNHILQSNMLAKAMSDTALQQLIPAILDNDENNDGTIEMAIGFQKLAVKSMEQSQCPEHHVTIAYELLRLSNYYALAAMVQTRTTTKERLTERVKYYGTTTERSFRISKH